MSGPTVSPGTPGTLPGVRPPVVVGWVAIGVAVAWVVVSVLTAVVASLTKGEMQAWVEGAGGDDSGYALIAVLAVVEVLLMLAAWIAAGIWLLGIRRVATATARGYPHRRSEVWAVLGWVVPVVSLWFPYQVVADALSSLRGRSKALLPVWWTCWLVAMIGGNATGRLGGDLMTADQVGEWVAGLGIASLLMVLALPSWILVVRRLTSAAQSAAEGTAGTASQ